MSKFLLLICVCKVLLAVVSESGKTLDVMGETEIGVRKADRDPQTLMDVYRQKGDIKAKKKEESF